VVDPAGDLLAFQRMDGVRPASADLAIEKARTAARLQRFTRQEQEGYDIFRGNAKCNDCHRDGGPGEDPLFTDFTASNIGTPASCPIVPKTTRISAAMLPTRAVRLLSISALAVFLRAAIHSVSLPLLMRAGNLWRRKIAVVSRCPRCAMWTSGPVPIL
jgi:hypothetical protein